MLHILRTYTQQGINSKRFFEDLFSYVSKLSLPEGLKKEIINFDFIKNNPSYYLTYPYLFVSGNNIDYNDVKLRDLSLAGFFYYKAIIYTDRVLDKDFELGQVYPIISVCNEECLKLLSKYFAIDSSFWTLWNRRKQEFLSALATDRNHQVRNLDDFLTLADQKSAFGKVAIDALYIIGYIHSEKAYNDFLKLHALFYAVFQMLDDIKDICEDFKKSQYNIAISMVMKSCGDNMIACIKSDKTGKSIVKYFFTNKLYEVLSKEGFKCLTRALRISNYYNLYFFEKEISKLWNVLVIHNLNIKAYLYELEVDSRLETQYVRNNKLNLAIEKSLQFLNKEQLPNGSWVDFCNNAGASDTWSTAFVSLMLKEAHIGEELLDKSINFLNGNKKNSLWGYSNEWICDNDSSIIGTLATNDRDNVEIIRNRMNSDHGTSTYYDKKELYSSISNVHDANMDINGWTQSHIEVSAAALYLFVKFNIEGECTKGLISFIKQRIKGKGELIYWWVDDIYFIFFLSKINAILHDDLFDSFIYDNTEKKFEIFIKKKEKLSFFFLGMLLHLLLYCNSLEKAKDILDYILDHQYIDGSWKESNFLCMPGVDDYNSKSAYKWDVADYGIRVRAHEFHRLYTTSVVLMAIKEFEEYDK